MTEAMAEVKAGVRVSWRARLGTITSDYWRDRDRFSVRFDGETTDFDFGADALTVLATNPRDPA